MLLGSHRVILDLSLLEVQIPHVQLNVVVLRAIVSLAQRVALEAPQRRAVLLKELQELVVSATRQVERLKEHQAAKAQAIEAQEHTADRKYRFLVG